MKKLIWKFRFAMHMRKRAGTSWRLAFEVAQINLDSYPDAVDECPILACDEELSYW